MRSEYDEQGRLTAVVDGSGNRTTFVHDAAARTDTVFDRLGNPTTFAYDNRGNVVAQVDALGGVTRRSFDSNNNLLMEVDPLGYTNTYTYDSNGNVLTSTDPLGNVTTNSYHADGNLLATTDPLGHTTTYEYNAAGNPTAIINPAGNETLVSYDSGNRVASLTDMTGNPTQFTHDSHGNLVQKTDSLGNTTTYTYDGAGNPISETTVFTLLSGAKRTNTLLTAYDAAGRVISETDAAGNTTKTEYTSADQVAATVDVLGHRTEFTYDARGNLIKTLFPDGTTSTSAYDEDGRKIADTDRENRTTYYQYDALGQLLAMIYPDGTTTSNEYDADGQLIATTDERGNRTSFAYDALGRQIAETNALGAVTTIAYDAIGLVKSQTDALGHSTYFLYDNLGHPAQTVFDNGTSRQATYNAMGRPLTITDEAGATIHFNYDVLGQLTNVVDALGHSTTYQYNEEGRLVRQTDANGHATRFDYETCCQRSTSYLPMGQRQTSIYSGGFITGVTNYNGQFIRYDYDVNNRLSAKRFPDGSSVRFTRTPTGKLESATDARGVTLFDYDLRDRPIRQTNPNGQVITYTYDDAGNRTSITTVDPNQTDARVTTHSYDALNRLQTVTSPDGGVTHLTYDAANNLVRAELPNGIVQTNAFDALNRLVYMENRNSSNVISSYLYTLGPAGKRLGVRENTGRRVIYDYDALNRLVGESVFNDPVDQNLTNRYAYDSMGNRTAWTLNGPAGTEAVRGYAYDANDQLLAETNLLNGSVTYFTYDGDGNTLSRSNATENAFYTWSADDRLVGADVTDTNGVRRQLSYRYDVDGIRVGQQVVESGQTNATTYVVDANQPYQQVLEEWQSLNGQAAVRTASYTYGNGLQLLSQTRAGAHSYYVTDGLGSTRALADSSGKVTDRYDYDAYGRTLRQSGSTVNPYLFAGQQRDALLGLDYLRARYLNVRTGRFYGRDPLNGQFNRPLSLNRFLDVEDDPVNRIDPSGQEDTSLASVTFAQFINSLIEKGEATYEIGKAYCKASSVLSAVATITVVGGVAYAAYEAHQALGQFENSNPLSPKPGGSGTSSANVSFVVKVPGFLASRVDVKEFALRSGRKSNGDGVLGFAYTRNSGAKFRLYFVHYKNGWQASGQAGFGVPFAKVYVCGQEIAELSLESRIEYTGTISGPKRSSPQPGYKVSLQGKIKPLQYRISAPIIGGELPVAQTLRYLGL